MTNSGEVPDYKSDFRLRVEKYRVLFDVDTENKTIYILKIGHRKDIY